MAFNFNQSLPFKNNPWYNSELDGSEILDLFISEETSKELVEYCIKQCKTKLPFFKTELGKLHLKDIDFLLRFWKRETYFSEPAITLTGKE